MKRNQLFAAVIVAVTLVMALSVAASAADGGKININSATVDELAQLDQIGSKTAQRIVDYRKANGPFKSPEDLMNVKGIGEKIFLKNKERISI